MRMVLIINIIREGREWCDSTTLEVRGKVVQYDGRSWPVNMMMAMAAYPIDGVKLQYKNHFSFFLQY